MPVGVIQNIITSYLAGLTIGDEQQKNLLEKEKLSTIEKRLAKSGSITSESLEKLLEEYWQQSKEKAPEKYGIIMNIFKRKINKFLGIDYSKLKITEHLICNFKRFIKEVNTEDMECGDCKSNFTNDGIEYKPSFTITDGCAVCDYCGRDLDYEGGLNSGNGVQQNK